MKKTKSIYDPDLPWDVYIVECADGTYYTGISHNLNKRLDKHNRGKGAVYTEKHSPVDLVYFEICKNHKEAAIRELEIKDLTHKQKKDLIDNFFPLQ